MPIGSNWAGDDHQYPAVHRWDDLGQHFQVTAIEAAERGWYYKTAWYRPPEPDTRRCRNCGKILFEAFTLTEEERNIRSPMSTTDLLNNAEFGP